MVEPQSIVMAPEALEQLLAALRARGYRVLGPSVRDGAIVYDDLTPPTSFRSAGPTGRTAARTGSSAAPTRRASATPSVRTRGSGSSFRRACGSGARAGTATAYRRSRRSRSTRRRSRSSASASCELHAIEIQDTGLLGGKHVDRDYAARRDGAFLVAVNCFEPGGTCFCTSMGTGPKAESGYDLALTELLDGEHRFLVEAGSERGAEVLAELPSRAAVDADLAAAAASIESAAARMGRTMDTFDIRDLLARNLEHPRWDEVATRCLTCGNCTLVCPTCFCSAVEDETDLSGEEAERFRVWDNVLLGRLLVHPRRQRPPVGTLALPPVDDPQARHVARPVRLVRLRRLRPLHHVVPGRHRHHRGGRGDPRDGEGARRCRTRLRRSSPAVPFFAGLDAQR